MPYRKPIPYIETDADKTDLHKGGASQDQHLTIDSKVALISPPGREILSPKNSNTFPRTPRTTRTPRTPHRERSASPTREDRRYLPNSHARAARDLAKRTIRECPSFD